MADHHGWKVAAAFTSAEEEARRVRESAGLGDECWRIKIEIRSVEPVKVELPKPADVWPLARGHALVTCGPEDRETTLRDIRTFCSSHPCARWTDVSPVTATLVLAGPQSREILGKLVSLDVSDAKFPGGCARATGLGPIHVTLLRQDLGGVPAFRILVGREVAEFVWDAIRHAGEVVPFGLGALQLLERSPVAASRAR